MDCRYPDAMVASQFGQNTVTLAGMPKSRPWTVASWLCKCLIQLTCQPVVSCSRLQGQLSWPQVCHPWTLDSGIPAGMTVHSIVFCSFPSTSLGMQSWKHRLPLLSQARACRAKVPKLELGKQYTKYFHGNPLGVGCNNLYVR